MEKEDLVLGLFGRSNMQITHGFANDFSVTSSGFPKQIIFMPANTDYTLPFHKKKKKKWTPKQKPQGFSHVLEAPLLSLRGKKN